MLRRTIIGALASRRPTWNFVRPVTQLANAASRFASPVRGTITAAALPSYLNARSIAIWFVVVLAFLAVWGVFLPLKARGQDHHHALHEDFYRHWMQPGTNISCCNARVEVNGVETGDCEPVKAEVRAGNWWAWLRQESRWIEIDDSRIIRERNPEQGGQQGHLCYSYGRVLCFVPPDSGG